jgi:hypothetical protein
MAWSAELALRHASGPKYNERISAIESFAPRELQRPTINLEI